MTTASRHAALPFANRTEAGRALALVLDGYRDRDDVIVLALPRGGLPVAWEVARHLGVPLDLMLVRKLGMPGNRELAMGAIASGDVCILNDEVVSAYQVSDAAIESAMQLEQKELARRELAYRGGRPQPMLDGRCVVLVDDGIATGATALAAVDAARARGARSVVVATPVAPPDTLARLQASANAVHCLATPSPFYAIGSFYRDFSQLSDDDVMTILHQAWETAGGQGAGPLASGQPEAAKTGRGQHGD